MIIIVIIIIIISSSSPSFGRPTPATCGYRDPTGRSHAPIGRR